MKKINCCLFLFVFFMLFSPVTINALSIHDYKIELNDLETEERKTQEKIKLTEQEIINLTNEIENIHNTLNDITNETIQKEKEIFELEKEIELKDAEIKKIMSAHQISSGDVFYLEYLFGATSITDFIIRYSITEQLTKYNDELIKTMNKKIVENEKIKIELAKQEVVLKNKKILLAQKKAILYKSVDQLGDVQLSILEQIDAAREVIRIYEEAGCGEFEDLKQCAINLIPPDTGFKIPLTFGRETSSYTTHREIIYDKNGKIVSQAGEHLAVDISNSEGLGSKVYSIANGKVVFSARLDGANNGCEYICIHHNINGIGYTSCYAHLQVRNVRIGDIVSKNTVIGLMGNTGNSSAPHVHFSIDKGLMYLNDNTKLVLNLNPIDPFTVIDVPYNGTYHYWYSR